jgi:hypothetical protein
MRRAPITDRTIDMTDLQMTGPPANATGKMWVTEDVRHG